jgi:hypothetical protein
MRLTVLHFSTLLATLLVSALSSIARAEPPPTVDSPGTEAPTEQWVIFGEAEEGVYHLSYNLLDPRAQQFVSELKAMGLQLQTMETAIATAHASIPAADMQEIETLTAVLNQLMIDHPDEMPEDRLAEAMEQAIRLETLRAKHSEKLEQLQASIEQYSTYYDTVYETKWDAFVACSCSRSS